MIENLNRGYKNKNQERVYFFCMSRFQVSLPLKKGDRINRYEDGLAVLADSNGYPVTQFTRFLLEKDIELI